MLRPLAPVLAGFALAAVACGPARARAQASDAGVPTPAPPPSSSPSIPLDARRGDPIERGQFVPLSPADVPRRPWTPRHRKGVRVLADGDPTRDPAALRPRRLRALGLRGGVRTVIANETWPREPAAPALVRRSPFVRALGCLCGPRLAPQQVERIADATLASAATFGVDPFALAALAYHQSACEAGSADSYGIGLTRVNLGMHAAHIDSAGYRFARPLASGGFAREQLALGGRAFTAQALLEPEAAMHFTAAFLHVFEAQCPEIDRAFGSVPHRTPLAHMIFGDSVRSALPEALILTARRRLLSYYDAQSGPLCIGCERGGSMRVSESGLLSPLDGAPRIAIGVMGDPRDRGTRLHAGIDLMAMEGEPVRAVAAGTVVSAGVDLLAAGLIDLPPERAVEVAAARMGPRGLFVRVDHGAGVVSLYAHLASYGVHVGQRVRRGELLGYVGRTGVLASDAHLHFGLFEHGHAADPLPALGSLVIAVERGFVVDRGALQRVPPPHAHRRP